MKNLIGIIILATGIIFLLSNSGVIDMQEINLLSFWPILIVIIGLKIFFEGLVYFIQSIRRGSWRPGKSIMGLLILAIGVILLGNNAGWFMFTFGDLWSWTWPILIVYIGFSILFNRNAGVVINLGKEDVDKYTLYESTNKRKKRKSTQTKYHTFIGDIVLGRQPWELDGADVSMGIGSVDIDLTKAVLKEGENIIDIRSWIGSVEILVPKDLAVKAMVDVRIGEVTLFNDSYSGTSRTANFTSPNFNEADKQVIIYVNLNIGDVEVLAVD